MSSTRFKILVCRGPECGDKRSSATIYRALQAAIAERGLGGRVVLEWQSCFGRCTQGPNALVSEEVAPPPGQRTGFGLASLPVPRGRLSALYNHLTTADAAEILDEHVLRGRVVRRLIEKPGAVAAAGGPGKDPTRRDP